MVPFDDRTIAHIFSEALTAILLFNKEDSKKLSSEFANAATEWKKTGDKPIIFS